MRKYFLTGLFVLLPVVITLYVLVHGFLMIDGVLGGLVHSIVGRHIPGAGLALTIVLVFGTGLFATNILGRKLIGVGESILLRIPIVRNIYQGVHQLTDAFSNSTGKDAFKRVVLIEYPRAGVWSMAFVTSESTGEVQAKTMETCVTLFIPTTPNPTSGFFLIVPQKDCIPLDMSVEKAFKLIISAGVLVPEWDPEDKGR